MYKSWYYKFFC